MIPEAFDTLCVELGERRHRALAWVSAEQPECDRLAAQLVETLERSLGPGVVVGDRAFNYCSSPVLPSRTSSLLGQTLPWAVYDAFSGFNPNAFAQLSGTVAAGGWLILLSPPKKAWLRFSDPEYHKLRVEPWTVEMLAPNFLARLIHQLENDNGLLKLSPEEVRLPTWPVVVSSEQSPPPPYMSLDQQRVVESLVEQSGKRRFSLVLSADRGRGKSAAIGLALVEIARKQPLHVVMTAPSRTALGALLERIECEMGTLVWVGGHARVGELDLTYLPPAELQLRLPPGDLLVIDEAAAIATPVLSRLSRHYRREIFSTTQHGYEGNGRGFTLRFLDELKRIAPGVQELTLTTPVRWASQDPLERLVSQLLLLDAEPEMPAEVQDEERGEPLRVETLQQKPLALDEALLRQLFGLLILAHYRTTPGDLRVLLDSPNLDIHILRRGDQLLGCALVAREGPLSPELSQGVWEGHRRPTGHLLPQALIAHEGEREVAPWSAWRILRIAIHPAVQQQGLGRYLLDTLVERAADSGVDYLGASFGATDTLLRYWQRCGFLPVRVGEQLDPVSGCHSVIVLRALSEPCRLWFDGMRERYSCRLRYRLSGTLSTLEDQLLPELFSHLPVDALTEGEVERLGGFAYHQRSLESSLLELDKLLLATVQHWPEMGIGGDDQSLLVSRIWRQQPPGEVGNPPGRNAQLARLRQLVALLLDRKVLDRKVLDKKVLDRKGGGSAG